MSFEDAVAAMGGGNPGSIAAMAQMCSRSTSIDPDNLLRELGPVVNLDNFGIYDGDIYILFSDICGRDVARTLAVLRATQLGMFDAAVLADACSRQDYSGRAMVPVDDLYKKVRERLPNFDSQN